jgi:hypothetical protein
MRTPWLLTVLGACCLALAAQNNNPSPVDQSSSTAAQPSSPQASNPAPAAKPAKPNQDDESKVIPKGSKVFIAPMPDNFDQYLKDAISKKSVPITLVDNRDQAEFEITGYSETQKASTAKKLIMGSWHSRESASVKVANLKTGIIAFAYSYNNDNSAHGKRSSSEACAKHLKEKIESGK